MAQDRGLAASPPVHYTILMGSEGHFSILPAAVKHRVDREIAVRLMAVCGDLTATKAKQDTERWSRLKTRTKRSS
jgi:hypothetical protein